MYREIPAVNGESNDGFQRLYNQELPDHNQTTGTTKKTCVFAILAIVGLSGLVVGVVGLVQVLQSGALTNQAIIMMATGGAGGTLLLITGIVGLVKNCQRASHQPNSARQTQIDFIQRTAKGGIRDRQPFGKAEWERYFGEVGEEPSLPNNLDAILNAPCPFSGDESVKVKDTHMLVLIPATVGGENKPLTLNSLQELIKNPIENSNGHPTDYVYYSDAVREPHGDTGSAQSYWVLMTRDVIPGSRETIGSTQEKLLNQHAEGAGYTLPKALEAAVCIVIEYVFSGHLLFDREPLTYTHCSEKVTDGYPVIVGSFESSGLTVTFTDYVNIHCGFGALRKFS